MTPLLLIAALAVGQAEGPPAPDDAPALEQSAPGRLWLDADYLVGRVQEDDAHRSGLRLGVGAWLDCDRSLALAARGFCFLPEERSDTSPLGPIGFVTVTDRDDRFCGGDLSLLKVLGGDDTCRLAASLGYRYLHLSDSLDITGVFPAAGFAVNQRIEAINSFNGVDAGLIGYGELGCWTFDAFGRVAVGNGRREIRFDGPLFGRSEIEELTVVSEVGVGVGCRLSECVGLRAGYSFLNWADVARSSEQLDPRLPLSGDRTSDLRLHVLSLGVEWRY